MHNDNIKQIVANTLRILSCDMIEKAQSGHPGMPLGFADVITALLYEINFDHTNPTWVNRDRIIFSCGHGCALWYSTLYGFGLRSKEDLAQFRQLGSNTPGHLEHGNLKYNLGIDMTTGPLGMGFAWAVGMALAERILHQKHEEIDHHTYIICSDGDLMEGVSYEAAAIAGQYQLHKIIALWDDNSITIDGPTDISRNENIAMRFKAQNWHVIETDGHDIEKTQQAIKQAKMQDKPTLIACKTTIGKYSALAGTSKVHGSPLGAENFEKLKKAINYDKALFLKEFENIKALTRAKSDNWHKKYKNEDFVRCINLTRSQNLATELVKDYATRKHSENILEQLINENDNIIIASADLSTSCGTKPKSGKIIHAHDFSGNLLPCGVRENAMVAIVGGLTMHSKLQGIASTFLVFTDYARPAIRLAALMNIPVILIATHDSIALGEDGPTHQPIEHLDALRCIPNLLVARPADGFETFYCYENIFAHSRYDNQDNSENDTLLDDLINDFIKNIQNGWNVNNLNSDDCSTNNYNLDNLCNILKHELMNNSRENLYHFLNNYNYQALNHDWLAGNTYNFYEFLLENLKNRLMKNRLNMEDNGAKNGDNFTRINNSNETNTNATNQSYLWQYLKNWLNRDDEKDKNFCENQIDESDDINNGNIDKGAWINQLCDAKIGNDYADIQPGNNQFSNHQSYLDQYLKILPDNLSIIYILLNNFLFKRKIPNYHAKPVILVLTRQNMQKIHENFISSENLEFLNEYEKNGYIISCGSELSLAVQLGKYSKKMVISMPFFIKKEITQNSIHIIEASSSMCWNYLFPGAKLFNITHFGASGKQSDLLQKFGFTFETLSKWIEITT